MKFSKLESASLNRCTKLAIMLFLYLLLHSCPFKSSCFLFKHLPSPDIPKEQQQHPEGSLIVLTICSIVQKFKTANFQFILVQNLSFYGAKFLSGGNSEYAKFFLLCQADSRV